MAAAKKTLRERLTPGKMSGWLPAVALFLCLSMFAIAALVLFQVGSDPKSPQSAVPTAISAQGFAGLRRLLDADGHFTVINRYEDTGTTEKGDLEVITLDDATGLFLNTYDALDAQARQDEEGEEASAGEASSAEAVVSPEQMQQYLDGGIGGVPDPVRVNHILHKPLGKAVLIVAPKWGARADPRHPRWAQAPVLRETKSIAEILQVLAPVSESPTQYDADDRIVPQPKVEGRKIHIGEDTTYSYDVVAYDVQRRSRPAPAKPQKANPKNDPIIALGNQPDPDIPVDADVTVSPAPGQTVFTAPLKVGKIAGLQTISGPNLQPVLVTVDGRAVLSRVVAPGMTTKAPVYLLSDPDLLNNQILAQPEKVVAALDLVDKVTTAGITTARSAPGTQTRSSSERGRPTAVAHKKIVFNMTFNGQSFDRDLLHALSRPPFVAVPLAMLILGLALMWTAFARFGPAQENPAGPPLGRGVKTLADNAARLMAVTFNETRLGPAYAIMVRDQVIRGRGLLQVDPAQSLDALAERIGTTHGTTDSYLKLKDKAAQVANVHQLIDVTLKLHAWKTEIERAHI